MKKGASWTYDTPSKTCLALLDEALEHSYDMLTLQESTSFYNLFCLKLYPNIFSRKSIASRLHTLKKFCSKIKIIL